MNKKFGNPCPWFKPTPTINFSKHCSVFRGGKRKDDIFLCLGAVNVKTTVSVQTRLWQNWRAWWGRSLSIPGGNAIFVDTLYHIQTIRYKLYIQRPFWQFFNSYLCITPSVSKCFKSVNNFFRLQSNILLDSCEVLGKILYCRNIF